jgi:hypothetical protein
VHDAQVGLGFGGLAIFDYRAADLFDGGHNLALDQLLALGPDDLRIG